MGGRDVRLLQACVHSSIVPIPSAISLQTATGPREEGGLQRQSGDSRETRDLSRRSAPFSTPPSNCPTFGILTTRSRFTCGERADDREESPLSNP